MVIKRKPPPLTTGDLLGIIGFVAAVMSYEADQWGLRAFLAVVAIGLTVYGGRRHSAHPAIRLPIAIGVIVFLSYSPWKEIAEDFHRSHPLIEWPMFVKAPLAHFSLAAVATATLLWGSLRAWHFSHRLLSFGRRFLGEQVWIDRETALKSIRSSDWAKLKEPTSSIFDAFSGGYSPAKAEIMFTHYIEMALKNFEYANESYVREQDGQKQFLEDRLLSFINQALDGDAIKRFGDLPSGSV
jgi:hypothetical protein